MSLKNWGAFSAFREHLRLGKSCAPDHAAGGQQLHDAGGLNHRTRLLQDHLCHRSPAPGWPQRGSRRRRCHPLADTPRLHLLQCMNNAPPSTCDQAVGCPCANLASSVRHISLYAGTALSDLVCGDDLQEADVALDVRLASCYQRPDIPAASGSSVAARVVPWSTRAFFLLPDEVDMAAPLPLPPVQVTAAFPFCRSVQQLMCGCIAASITTHLVSMCLPCCCMSVNQCHPAVTLASMTTLMNQEQASELKRGRCHLHDPGGAGCLHGSCGPQRLWMLGRWRPHPPAPWLHMCTLMC